MRWELRFKRKRDYLDAITLRIGLGVTPEQAAELEKQRGIVDAMTERQYRKMARRVERQLIAEDRVRS